jgi:hypothetical protein
MELADAFAAPLGGAAWEKNDNPCGYTTDKYANEHSAAKRHMLGMVGGNEVSRIAGVAVDLESDLRGITRIHTHVPWKQHQPVAAGGEIKVNNWKRQLEINTRPVHLEETQMWAYPAAYAPQAIVRNNCMEPHKF